MFHDVRLPDQVERGASGGPSFSTTVLDMTSGHEQRNIDWQLMRSAWDLAYGIQRKADYHTVLKFFYGRRGKAYGFRFKDWSDYKLDDELVAIGDGTETTFQLTKTYDIDGPAPYVRNITRPIEEGLSCKVDGVPTGFTLGDYGVVTLFPAPGDGALVTFTGEFDVPVRFDTDKFDLTLEWEDAGAVGSLPIIELRENVNA